MSRSRVFDPGELKLLALHLLAEHPRHGYELIQAIGSLAGGDYSPSPGTVYPTLTLLEDLGWAAAEAQADGRRLYAATESGRTRLAAQAEDLAALLERLSQRRRRERARRTPDIERAMENLKTALRLRFSESTPDADTVRRIADLIDQAAVAVGRV